MYILTEESPIELEFEWDDRKRQANIAKHGIDFGGAIGIFEGPMIVQRSDRNGEDRWLAIGELNGHVIAVVYTGTTLGVPDHFSAEGTCK